MAKKKLTDDAVLRLINSYREKAKDHQEDLSEKRDEYYRYYRAEPYGNERPRWSQTVMPVSWNIVEALKPGLLEIFLGDFFVVSSVNKTPPRMQGGTGVPGVPGVPLAVSMQGQMVPGMPQMQGMPMPPQQEPAKPRDIAQDIQDYIRHKLFVQMDGEQIMDDVIHYALTSHYGVLKVTHREDYKEIREQYDFLTPEQFSMVIADELTTVTMMTEIRAEAVDGVVDGVDLPVIGYEDVKVVRRELVYRGPWVEVVPPRELYYVPGYASLDKCPYVAHVVKRDLDYVLRMERRGVYKKGSHKAVKDLLAERFSTVETEGELDTMYDVDGLATPYTTNLADDDKLVMGNNEILVEEIYTNMDIDGDGLLEPVILTVCESVVLREPEENPYGSAPFELATALREPDKIIGRPFPEVFDEWQRMMTVLTRGIQDAAMLSTARGWKTNDAGVRAALQNWGPGDTLLMRNPMATAEVLDFGNPSDFILRALERTQYEIDKASGVNEAMQGLDKTSMNRTASGMEMRLSSSQERQRLIARRISRCWKRVVRRVIDIMRIWPPEDDAKVVGRDIVISEADLRGEFTVDVEVGVGPVDRKKNAEAFAQLAAFLSSPVAIQLGIGNQDSILEALRSQFEYLDVDTTDILPTKEQVGMAQKLAQLQQHLGKMQQQMGMVQEENAFLQRKAAGKDPQLEMQKVQVEAQVDAQKMGLAQQNDERRLQMEYALKRDEMDREYALKEREMLMKFELEREKARQQLALKAASSLQPPLPNI